MTLPVNIALNNSFSSTHDLNDVLDITALIIHRISAYATATDLSIESKVGNKILLLLRASDNASALLMSKCKIYIDSLVFIFIYVCMRFNFAPK